MSGSRSNRSSTDRAPGTGAGTQRIAITPGGLLLYPAAFADAAPRLLEALHREIRWEQHELRLFGRRVPAPRLSAWHAEAGQAYRYSGITLVPRPLTPALSEIRERIRALTGQAFDSVLLNLYRDGRDGMSWHSDDEPELGAAPLIAAVSLGATRRFALRTRSTPRRRVALALESGSLLLMEPPLQAHWQHALPKTARACGPRISLTWRRIVPPGSAASPGPAGSATSAPRRPAGL